MPSHECTIEIDEDGEFDVEFTRFAKANHRGAARLITRLEAFATNRNREGEFLRGAASKSIFVVPPRDRLDDDGDAGLLALVDDASRTVSPLRFIYPSQKHRWSEHVKWAEKFLGI
jgi:hypothetical protein